MSETLVTRGDEFLKSAKDVAEGISAEVIPLHADRLDRILNGQIMPHIGLHGALIGTAIALPRIGAWPRSWIAFAVIAVALWLTYFVSGPAARRQSGLPGAAVAFATAATVIAPLPWIDAGMLIAAAYVLLAAFVLLRNMDARVLLFAPVYSAIFINLSSMQHYEVPLYAIPLCIGLATLLGVRRMNASFGLFAGLLWILAAEIASRTSGTAMLATISSVAMLGLLAYMVVAVAPSNSNFKNFAGQSLPALTIVAIITTFTDDRQYYWLWPIALSLFFVCVSLLRGQGGLPTAIGWCCIAIIMALWLTNDQLRVESWATRSRMVATLLFAEGLYVIGVRLRNRFVSNLGMILLLIGGLVCLQFAVEVRQSIDGESAALPLNADIGTVLRWHTAAISASVGLSILAATLAGLSYLRIDPSVRIPWWRGFVRPRHAVLIRSGYRVAAKWFDGVPLVGPAFKAVRAIGGAMRYLKTGAEPFQFTDIAVLAAVTILGLSTMRNAASVLAGLRLEQDGNDESIVMWLPLIVAWTLCAIVLYAYGLRRMQSLFVFAGAAFAFVPIVTYFSVAHPVQLWQAGIIGLAAGLTLVLCSAMRRGN